MKTIQLLILAVLLSATSFCTDAHTQIINLDINGFAPGFTPEGATYNGQGALASPGDFWNGYSVTNNTDPNVTSSLFDSMGNATTVTFDLSRVFAFNDGASVAANNPAALLGDWAGVNLFGDGSLTEINFTISGLNTGDNVNLYLYGTHNTSVGGTRFIVDGITNVTSGGNNSTFVEGQNYVKYMNLAVNVSGQITGKFNIPAGSPDFAFASLNGFQLEILAVPEPSTYGLIAISLIFIIIVYPTMIARRENAIKG